MSELRKPMGESAERLLGDISTAKTWGALDKGQWDSEGWNTIAEAGLHLVAVPEEQDGVGGDFGDLAHLARIAGYHAVPQPLVEAMVAHWLLGLAGQESMQRKLVVPLIEMEELPRIDIQGRVFGTVRRAAWARHASHWAVPAMDVDGHLVLAEIEAEDHPDGQVLATNVAREPRDTVTLDGRAACSPARPLPLSVEAVRQAMAVVRAQQTSGAMRRALNMTMEYVSDRKQFGRPLSKFQAVQHMLSQAATEVAACLCIADTAADAWGSSTFGVLAAVAKARVSESVRSVADAAHQCHGAMGFTHECSLHFFTRRMWAWRDEYGNESHWHRALSASIAEAGGYSKLWETASAL